MIILVPPGYRGSVLGVGQDGSEVFPISGCCKAKALRDDPPVNDLWFCRACDGFLRFRDLTEIEPVIVPNIENGMGAYFIKWAIHLWCRIPLEEINVGVFTTNGGV